MSLLPNYSWFVLVQPTSGDWANSRDGGSETHVGTNLCGKNLLVWGFSGVADSCNENTAGLLAKTLIDAAVGYGGTTSDIRDYITNSKQVMIDNKHINRYFHR